MATPTSTPSYELHINDIISNGTSMFVVRDIILGANRFNGSSPEVTVCLNEITGTVYIEDDVVESYVIDTDELHTVEYEYIHKQLIAGKHTISGRLPLAQQKAYCIHGNLMEL